MSDKTDYVLLPMDTDRERFIRVEVPAFLRGLSPDARPLWGIMSPRHMVEHLIYITGNLVGDRPVEVFTPAEKLPRYLEFLRSPYGFMRNFKFPLLPREETMPLVFGSLEEAVDGLDTIQDRFFDLVKSPLFTTLTHPIYGELNRGDAVLFQFKHVAHHLMQFGWEFQNGGSTSASR